METLLEWTKTRKKVTLFRFVILVGCCKIDPNVFHEVVVDGEKISLVEVWGRGKLDLVEIWRV